jgi:hypothetical protein
VINDDESFKLRLKQFLVMPQQVTQEGEGFAYSTEPAHIVADYEPVTIHGELTDGTLVCLLDAHMEHGPACGTHLQEYTGLRRIVGVDVIDNFAPIGGIRWGWNVALSAFGASPTSETVGGAVRGTLSFWAPAGQDGKHGGLEFTVENPASLRDLLTYVQSASNQLVALWGGRHRVPQVSVTEVLVGDKWGSYIVPKSDDPRRISTDLLALKELSIETFAKWIPLARSIDPFPYIANMETPNLQVAAQVLATALEGIHRSLHAYEYERPFASVSRGAVKRARKAAQQAGVCALEEAGFADLEFARKRFSDSLGHVDQPSYAERIFELATDAAEIIPGLFGPDLGKWVALVKDIRNNQSHQLGEEFHEVRISEYFVAVQTVQWVLSLTILLRVVQRDLMRNALAKSNTLHFTLANIDAEGVWEGYSALHTFERAASGEDLAGEPPTSV